MAKYIYQYPDWPHFIWDEKGIQALVGEVRHQQGKIIGQMNALGFSVQETTSLATLTEDIIKSSEIEGEMLNYDQVRSSIARRLGIETVGMVASNRYVEGVVEMMLDATQNYNKVVDHERLFGWHAALFPTGRSGLQRIEVGQYRTGEMQVVSGAMGKEKVHFEAPAAENIPKEMDLFIRWINSDTKLDSVLKSAIAHFWFIIIHPFDDGNGRIARAISDLLLARSDDSSQRFYSLSAQILAHKKQYYAVLQKVQHSSGDITNWLSWYLDCLQAAFHATEDTLVKVLNKSQFWEQNKDVEINHRQRLLLNRLLDGFDGKLTSSKWAKIAKCSADTALRDIQDLLSKGILRKEAQGGRSTNYELEA